MTPAEAKKILEGMGLRPRTDELSIKHSYVNVYRFGYPLGKKVKLDGEFTADELEAIATWMRDPEGVAGA